MDYVRNYSKKMEIVVRAEFHKRNKNITKEMIAMLDTEVFTFVEISNFTEDLNMINRFIKNLTRNGNPFEMTISIAEYDYTDWELNHNIRTISFHYWSFSGYNELPFDISEMGVYLQADTKYTPQENDAWYDFTLKSLPHV